MDPILVLSALLVTLIAGLSTGIGGLLSMFQKRNSSRFLAVSLGFSAGVMIYLSFVEILPEGFFYLQQILSDSLASVLNVASFFFGILVIALIDRFVPSIDNPHEIPDVQSMIDSRDSHVHKGLLRTGFMTAIAIAIHNIPEGIAVAVPIYFATGKRRRAFLISLASGLSEMLGAIIGLMLFSWLRTDLMLGIVLAATAGIMIYISFDELLPTAEKYGEHHLAIYGVLSGMGVMAVSLLLL